MNKNNFQVGDYCRHAGGAIAIVAKVEKDRGFACQIGNSEYLWSYNNRFEPIPLTEEILEKFGFRVVHETIARSRWEMCDTDDQWIVECTVTKHSPRRIFLRIYVDGNPVVQIWITDVHILQHALHLCGLTDLADNLKLD